MTTAMGVKASCKPRQPGRHRAADNISAKLAVPRVIRWPGRQFMQIGHQTLQFLFRQRLAGLAVAVQWGRNRATGGNK